jgi:hypothetical protein
LIRKKSNRPLGMFWAAVAAAVVLALAPAVVRAQSTPTSIRVVSDDTGTALQVNGQDFMVFGMNWGYMPIGENYLYDFWNQPDDFIEAALADEMPLLTNMGVNTIRQYVGIPPRWVRYIYERYGIYTIINHPVARWGYTLDGVWLPTPDYSNPRLREAVTAEIAALVDEFRGVPGVLMWLLGNENNYGLSWSSFEIEALPEGERDRQRRPSVHRHHRRGVSKPRRSWIECLPRHLRQGFLSGDQGQARYSGHVHRVRRGCVERQGDA